MGFGSNKGFTPGDEGLQVAEADGAPDVTGVKKIVVSNGTLTDNGNGQVTLTTGGGAGGDGDVVGPGSSTDNAVARFDLATGKLLQNSTLLVSDTAQIGVATDPDLIVPTSGSVTINIGDVSGSDFKVVAAGATGAGGHEILHVQGDTQKIGIGETAPSSKLHILSADKALTLEKSPTGFFNSFGFDANIPYMTYYSTGGGGMKLGYGESTGGPPTVNTMFLDNNGSVGIGTLSPSAKLNLETTASTVMHISRDGSASTVFNSANWALGTIGFGGQDTDSGQDNDAALIEVKTAAAWTATGHGTYMAFSTTADDAVATTERMRIESDGYVGIGIAAPAVPLHVVATPLDFVAKFASSDASAAIIIEDNASTANGNRIQVTGDEMRLFTAGTERVRIDNVGLVGIGAINPLSQLHISGTSAKQVVTLENNGGRVDIGLAGGGSDILAGSYQGDLVISNETGNDILFGTSNAQRMIIDKAGNVGIGPNVDPPREVLAVSGSTIELRDDGTVNSNPGISIQNDARAYKLQTRGAQSDLFAIRDSNAGANRLSLLTTGLIGLGVDDPDAALEIFNTSTQLKLSYDASNYATQVVAADGELTLTTAGTDTTLADITLDPVSRFVNLGATANAAGVVNHRAAANGRLESHYKCNDVSFFSIYVKEDPDETKFCVGDSKQIALTTIANRLKNHDHAAPADPTLFIHSNTDPDTNNTQWVSLAHNQTDAILEVGKGSLVVTGAIGRKRGEPQFKIAYDGSNFAAFHVNDSGDLFLTSSGGDSTFSAASSMEIRRNGDVLLEIDSGNHLNSNRRFQLESDGGASNGQLSIGSVSNTDTIILKGGTKAVGIGGVVEPGATLHVSSSNVRPNSGPVLQVDSYDAGVIFAVTGSDTIGSGHVDISGSLKITKGEITALATTPIAQGAGFVAASDPAVTVSKINGEYVTTILLTMANTVFAAADKAVIGGQNGAAQSYITQITTATNGIVYKAEMSCLEVPTAGGGGGVQVDIDLTTNLSASSQGNLWDGGTSPIKLIEAGEDWTVGMTKESPVAAGQSVNWANVVNGYLFLANGASGPAGGYNAGKFIIKLYGASF